MIWVYSALAVLGVLAVAVVVGLYLFHRWVVRHYLGPVCRIFTEKPLFIVPFGKPTDDAEDLSIPSTDGVVLKGCYLKTKQPRRGVIFFGLEFGSKRWSSIAYCDFLLEAGYDIFACECRGQGDTPTVNGYEPLQWVTEYEIADYRAAIAYLKSRPDADPRGVGLFGLSKGGGTGLFIAAEDPYLRCFVTDGMFGTLTTMIPFMAQWVMIFTKRRWLASRIPTWYLRHFARITLRKVEEDRNVNYPSLVRELGKLSPRPLLMIHGGGDTYIKPDMARALFDAAREPKEFWLVEKAKHNQAFHLANAEYKRRVLEFFNAHLANAPSAVAAAAVVATNV